ncbi:ABC transporter ATP-binding protein [Singulisphaera acidiphila]|nr:ABC transporter ATP-binding protein [Singulisphaera acidiphila]
MAQREDRPLKGIWLELQTIAARGREVWRLVSVRHRWALGVAVLVMGFGSAASTAIPLLLGTVVNSVNQQIHQHVGKAAVTRVALFYLALIGGFYLMREGLNVLRRFLVENACTRIDRDMCVRLVAHLMKVELSALSHEQVGALHGRITRSVDGFVRFLRLSFLDFIPAILTGGFAIAATLSRQPGIALAMAGVIPISISLTIWQLMTQKGVRLDLLRTREAMDGTVVEQLSGIDYIRAANTHRQEVLRVERTAERRRGKEIRHHFEMSLFGCGKALNEGLFHLLVIAFAIYLFLNGQIQNGDILTFSVLFLSVMTPLNEVHRFVDEAHECSLKVGDLIDILTEPADRSFQPAPAGEPSLVLGEPVFVTDDLHVDYRAADGRPRRALNGVSMTIRHGETIGVAGRSGGGKSTWLRVMVRLTHPSAGRAMLGGIPLESVSREAIGDLIGYVGQNPFVFSGTIAENIAYGQKDVTRQQVEDAAHLACLHDEIMAMHGGYDALVAERGQNLSGGQRQRLALARVFLKNPPILILDEGTSALDNISERLVQQAITAARVDRTVILVAHRLTTLRDANRILVFKDGQIAETGAYNELVCRGGVFAELVQSASEDSPANTNLELLFDRVENRKKIA